MLIEIWSDVVCPWCYIGKRRFTDGLRAFQAEHPEVAVEVVYRAFQLDPGAPEGRGEPVITAYAQKFGGPEQARAIMDRVSAEAAAEGLAFNMDVAQRANTGLAHRLLVLARTEGRQAELKERLMQAYFCDGESVGEIETLVRLAGEVGLDTETARSWLTGDGGVAEVRESLTTAAEYGITSVPTFVFDRKAAVPGAQPAEVFTRYLTKLTAANA